jgi:hydroxymethylbilane synthase
MRTLRLGTRGSRLAIIQSTFVADLLRAQGAEVELVRIVTSGDTRPPNTAWGEGAFVGALETGLRSGDIDLAVHSAKDVPIEPEVELITAAYPERADPRDALVLPIGPAQAPIAAAMTGVEGLPAGTVIGTDSPRRGGFLLAARSDLRVEPLHGNVDTRLAKLDRGDAGALILAVAGLSRLGSADRISARLSPEQFPPAPGQGALAVQIRAGDADVTSLVSRIDDPATRLAVTTERAVLERTGGGCRAPIGVHATVVHGRIRILAGVVGTDGSHPRFVDRSCDAADAGDLARSIGDALLEGAVA